MTRLYRCYPRIPGARRGKPGHWSYVPSPQLHGRWDNADLFDSWYFSRSAMGAVAESFYNKQRWIPEVFLTPAGHARALAVFEYDDNKPLLDLDDAAVLAELGVRPSQIVVQDLTTTQELARRIFARASQDHAGISWWSSQLPSENSVLLWGADSQPPQGLRLVGIEQLSVDHPAVIDAASRLFRVLG
ncbi:MAG: RES family NAD+ phosphorylase [Actinobacteria bacterium]|jgi:hypothetical protein|nr:RES family NAD+ phosphorylase [Actinomycetota bacterium]